MKSVLYKVKFKIHSEDEDEKYFAYCSEDISILLHRHGSYSAQFSNNKRPMLEGVEKISD